MNNQIKIQDFRIGNLVQDVNNKSIGICTGIACDADGDNPQISFSPLEGNELNPDNITPIEITEDWLLMFGFKELYGIWWITINKEKIVMVSEFISDDAYEVRFAFSEDQHVTIKLKYLHKLQNVVFAITGEELTLKPEDNE